MNMKKSLISLLVLLMTAVSGAWAQETVTMNHSANNTWTIAEMPGCDVDLEVEYFNITVPTANLAVIYAGSTTPLIYAGSTTEEGATMKYLVTATNEQPTSTDGFSADVPTAQGRTAGTYYVWYYLDLDSGDDSDISALAVEVTVIAAPYCDITMKGGTEDATSWQSKAGTGEYQALPLEGVALGTAVTVKYNGTKKVKSVKAKNKPLNLTSPAVGQVIGDDGKNYDYASLPDGVTAVAKICYVSGSNGLALALTDEGGSMTWNTAKTTCAAHRPAFYGGTWKLATQDEWNNMITAAGGYEALRDGFESVGGSNLESYGYWSSTEYEYDPGYEVLYPYAWSCHFNNGDWGGELRDFPFCRARACLAFWGSPAVGQVIGNDGKNYDYAYLPDGVTAVAKICYVSGSNGLALALADEGQMNWVTAVSTCAAHRPAIPGGTWKLATKDEWSNMITAVGGYEALRDGFSSVGGSNLQSAAYLSSTTYRGDAWIYDFGSCSCNWGSAYTDYYYRVRACLAFGALRPDPIELTSTDGKTWTLASMPYYDVELEVEYETALALNEVDDNTEKLTEWNGYEADVTLTRTLQAGSYNTFAAPFSTAIPDGWTVKELSTATFANGTLTLNFTDATAIVAGKPYLVKVAANTDLSLAAFTGAIVSKDAQPFTSTNVDFIPTLGRTTIEGSDTKAVLFLAAGNKLKNPTELPADMKGFRAYFQLKGEAALARAFSIDFGDGETTGIMAIDNGQLTIDNDRYYDLQGRKVNAAQKGVYIMNGKKVIK